MRRTVCHARQARLARRARLTLLALFPASALALAPGCNFQKLVADQMAGSLKNMEAAFRSGESPRQAREASPALLSMLDGFIVASPENPDLLLAAAEMNATAAFGFFEREDEDWARATHRKAYGYARRALAEKDRRLHRVVTEGTDEELRAKLARIEPGSRSIPALFWTAFAWGGLINMSRSDQQLVADLPRVVLIMERLAEVAPGFYNGGPHLFLAGYWSAKSPALGGNLEAAERHFQAVFQLTGRRALLPLVLYAEYLCVNLLGPTDPAEGRKRFVATLTEVLDAPDDLWPEERLQNEIAKGWAEELLPELDDLIFPPLPDEDPASER